MSALIDVTPSRDDSSSEPRNMIAEVEVLGALFVDPSLFVSGARPFLLWGTGFGLLWGTLFGPIAAWACAIWAREVVLPAIETEQLTSLVLALLG